MTWLMTAAVSLVAGLIGPPYRWYSYHWYWAKRWLAVALAVYVAANVGCALGAIEAVRTVLGHDPHVGSLAKAAIFTGSGQAVVRLHLGRLGGTRRARAPGGQKTSADRADLTAVLGRLLEWTNAALDDLTLGRVKAFLRDTEPDVFMRHAWTAFAETLPENENELKLSKASQTQYDLLEERLLEMQANRGTKALLVKWVAERIHWKRLSP
jgi:hypothetical protein